MFGLTKSIGTDAATPLGAGRSGDVVVTSKTSKQQIVSSNPGRVNINIFLPVDRDNIAAKFVSTPTSTLARLTRERDGLLSASRDTRHTLYIVG